MHHICENIKSLRESTVKTQQEVADLVNVKRSTYANWESKVIPDVASLIKLGEIFSVDWTSLVKETITGSPIKAGNLEIRQLIANTEALLKDTAKILHEIRKKNS